MPCRVSHDGMTNFLLMGDESGGSSSPFSLPTGTVTFLLTDIESSSRKWETDSGAMGPAVARHYEIVGDVVTRWEECARSSRVRATRSSPRSREHRTRSRRRSRRSGTSPTNSVSTSQSGSPCTPATRQLHDEGNYFGNTVIRCARLRTCGHGGQVLVSHTTADLVADRLPDGRRRCWTSARTA